MQQKETKLLLIFVPTYNERYNVINLCKELNDLPIDLDILFMDDSSPDGTGVILERLAKEYGNVDVVHRRQKAGIGSAHLEGINIARKRGYAELVTMDADHTHSPRRISELLAASGDLVIGSRFIEKGSMEGWPWFRRCLTRVGHLLTMMVLGVRYDSTGGFRLYRLANIPQDILDSVTQKGYAFFFESLYLFHLNNTKISEIPIRLEARASGHSKMDMAEICQSLILLIILAMKRVRFAINFKA